MYLTIATSIAILVHLTVATAQYDRRNLNGTAIPIIKSSSFLTPGNSIDFGALISHMIFVRAKILCGFENYEKNTGETHHALASVVKKRNDKTSPEGGNGVELTAMMNANGRIPLLWYTTITIGTPPKSFDVRIDTGASDFFIPGPNCLTCKGHTLWNPQVDSSTATAVNRRFYAKFSDKTYASGYLYTDNVTVAGFTAESQIIGAARIYSRGFRKSQFTPDGTMGMALRRLSSSGDNTVFETLVAERNLPDAVFSIWLTATGGELFIGGSNTNLYEGDFTYIRVIDDSYWQVKMEGIVNKGKEVMGEVDVIIDTGASVIGGNPSQVKSLHEKLGGEPLDVGGSVVGDFYTYPCHSFPTVGFIFGGRTFEIPPATLNIGPVSTESSDCISGIVGIDLGSTFWSIGGTFLQNVYTVFDHGNSRVGFATLKRQPAQPS